MRAVLAAALLILATAASAHAQSASARMSASVSVVVPVSVTPTPVAVSASAAGVDVTRPLAVGGSAPWVLEVVEGDAHDPTRRLSLAPRTLLAGNATAAAPVTVRLPNRPPSAGPRPVTYVIAMIN